MTDEPRSDARSEAALAAFVDALVAEVEPLQRAHAEAYWQASLTGDAAREAEAAALDVRIRTVFARAEPYRLLLGLAAAGGVREPLLARQLAVLLDAHRAQQIAPARIERMVRIERDLESRFNTHRARLDGRAVTDNDLRRVLVESDDGALRRRAWEASKEIGERVAGDLLGLVRLRNEAARDLGFADYYVMMLALDELDERELSDLLDAVERGTRAPWERYRRALDARLAARFGVAPHQVRPWHLQDPFFQEAPGEGVDLDRFYAGRRLETLAQGFFAAIGLDIGELLPRADLFEREGKSQHAFCLSVDRGADVRVLCNLRPDERWMSTLLHEFGHAVYDLHIDRTLPYFLRVPAHTLTTEASAMLFGRMSRDAAWLERWAGLPAGEARAVGEACARAQREQLLVQTRWMLVVCRMERALYRDPEQDLDTLWWDLVEDLQGVRRPEGRRAPDWASKIHFSAAPVYYQNYLLGEMMASQLRSHLLEGVLGGGPGAAAAAVTRPEVGEFLVTRLYREGRRRDWRGTLREATGGTLGAAAFVRALGGEA